MHRISHLQCEMDSPVGAKNRLRFIDPHMLRATEEHDKERVAWLRLKIIHEGLWTRPVLCLNREFILLDGHHRLAVAKSLDLARIPVFWISKDDEKLSLSSWRKGVSVQMSDVIAAGRSGTLLAKKTTRFAYATSVPNISVSLERLRRNPSPSKARATDALRADASSQSQTEATD